MKIQVLVLQHCIINADYRMFVATQQSLSCTLLLQVTCLPESTCSLILQASGHGRELGEWGLEAYLSVKQITTYVSKDRWDWYPASKL